MTLPNRQPGILRTGGNLTCQGFLGNGSVSTNHHGFPYVFFIFGGYFTHFSRGFGGSKGSFSLQKTSILADEGDQPLLYWHPEGSFSNQFASTQLELLSLPPYFTMHSRNESFTLKIIGPCVFEGFGCVFRRGLPPLQTTSFWDPMILRDVHIWKKTPVV